MFHFKKMKKLSTGKWGERTAVKFLKKNKIKLIDRNYYSRFGEIDIVGYDKKNKEYVFVEVKTRKNNSFGEPYESVDKYKLRKIYKTAMYYLMENNIENENYRFDVVSIIKDNEKDIHISHFKNIDIPD